jgi:hypothetical protein
MTYCLRCRYLETWKQKENQCLGTYCYSAGVEDGPKKWSWTKRGCNMVPQRGSSAGSSSNREGYSPHWQKVRPSAWGLQLKQSINCVAGIVFGLLPGWGRWLLGGIEGPKPRPSKSCDILSLLSHTEVNSWRGFESRENHLQELHLGMCLLSSKSEEPQPMSSESHDFHSILPPTGRWPDRQRLKTQRSTSGNCIPECIFAAKWV